MPIGTLTKKIHCQPRPPTRTPPASGPTNVATPAVAPHTLIATPRRSGGKSRVIVDRVCGVSNAAPSPWTTRAAISTLDAACQAAAQRGEGEHRQADQVEVPGPEAVTQPTRQQQRHGVGEQVCARHPDDRVVVGVELVHDRRIGDRDDRRVDEDHEEADHHRPQGMPRVVGRRPECRGHRGSPTDGFRPHGRSHAGGGNPCENQCQTTSTRRLWT